MTLLPGLVAVGCRQADEQAQQTASATAPGETARPDQGTGWTTDAPPVINGAPIGDTASVAERERQVAEREAAVAQREADLAHREAQTSRVVTSRPRTTTTTHRTSTPVSRVQHSTTPSRTSTASRDYDRAPAPAAAPAPRERVATHVTVPAGTSISAEVTNGVSSATAKVGDSVTARVTENVYAGGRLAIPSGSTVRGTVTDAHGLGRIGGQARLGVRFDSVDLPSGATAPVYATWSAAGRSETGRDTATIAGSTVGGAILGRVLSHGHRRTERTVGGAAAGAAIAALVRASTPAERERRSTLE